MRLKRGERWLAAFTALYILAFAAYYLSIRNHEFLWYVGVLVFFFALVAATLRRTQFDYTVLWGLSLWGLLHMAGGGVVVKGKVLYALELVPLVRTENLFILRFDQFVHFFGFGVATLVVYHLLKPYLREETNWKVVYPLLVAASSGLGALNEIVEFVAVLALPETGVGGYFNTALDLVFNLLGGIAAVIFIHFWRRSAARRRV